MFHYKTWRLSLLLSHGAQIKRAFDLVHKPALRLGMLKKAALQVRVFHIHLDAS